MELSSNFFNRAPYRELGTYPRPHISTKVLNRSLVNMLFHAGAVAPAFFALFTPLQVITVAMLKQIRYVGVIQFGFMFSNFH